MKSKKIFYTFLILLLCCAISFAGSQKEQKVSTKKINTEELYKHSLPL